MALDVLQTPEELICADAAQAASYLVVCGAETASDQLLTGLEYAVSQLPEPEIKTSEARSLVDGIVEDALVEARQLGADQEPVVDGVSAVFEARVEETLGHLQANQAGDDLRRNLNLAQQLIASAKSANDLLATAQLALTNSPLSDVGVFHNSKRQRPAQQLDNPRAFKRQKH